MASKMVPIGPKGLSDSDYLTVHVFDVTMEKLEILIIEKTANLSSAFPGSAGEIQKSPSDVTNTVDLLMGLGGLVLQADVKNDPCCKIVFSHLSALVKLN